MFFKKKKEHLDFNLKNVIDLSVENHYQNEIKKRKELEEISALFKKHLEQEIWKRAEEGKFDKYIYTGEFLKVFQKKYPKSYFNVVMFELIDDFKLQGFKVDFSELEGGYLEFKISWE